jgi:hypothetical protein
MGIKVDFGYKKMDLATRTRIGGQVRAWQERKAALERYNLKPHFCHNCGQPIEVGGKRVADVIRKKFCNSSCAASYNNKIRYQSLDTLSSTTPPS